MPVQTRRSYAGQSAADRQAERRTRLLDAAVELYGASGYHNTSVRMVCRKAGLTERYFYESFANSEALLIAAFRMAVNNLLALVQPPAAAAPDDAEQHVRYILNAAYARVAERPIIARFFLIETSGISAEVDRLFDESVQQLMLPLIHVCDPDESGAFARDSLCRRGVVGGLMHIAIAWIQSDLDRPLDEIVDAALPIAMLACR